VGGVPEVLPPSMIKFSEPNAGDLVDALSEAISVSRRIVPSDMHKLVSSMYSWLDVCDRTEIVYDRIMMMKIPSLGTRLLR
jgi:phosphatidylinositol glycan class A protein